MNTSATSTRPPAQHLFLFGLALALGLAAVPGEATLYLALAIAVAILGLPHGSFDTLVAKKELSLHSLPRLAAFIVAYLSIGALVVLLWVQAPTTALAAFLLYSALHFGDDVAPRLGRLGGFGYGLWLLSLPLALQPAAVEPIFNALGAMHTGPLLMAAPFSLAIGGALLAFALWRAPNRALSDWRDPLLFVGAAWVLHPLAYFIAYFCFLHSPRHLLLVARDLELTTWRERFKALAPTTLATYVLVAACVPFLLSLPTDDILLRLVFITLAALTVPHMLLEMLASPRRSLL